MVHHERNGAKGAAIHAALQHATGDVVLVHDADLEYGGDIPADAGPFSKRALMLFSDRATSRRRIAAR